MRIALIGARGQLGTDLGRRLCGDVVELDKPEFDVRLQDQVAGTIQEVRPDMVINCAALTDVDECEEQAEDAFSVNAVGAQIVAAQAQRCGAGLLYVSTDYVFGADGDRAEPYTEDDSPGPINLYGVCKLAGEHLSRACNSRCLVVRTSGLYGHAGALGKGGNFVETMLGLARQGETIRVVDDQRLAPTSTSVLADRLATLIEAGALGLYHIAAADSCSWFELADEIFRHEELAVDLQPISSSEFGARARRPAISALTSVRLASCGLAPCPPWRSMLHEYLSTRPAR